MSTPIQSTCLVDLSGSNESPTSAEAQLMTFPPLFEQQMIVEPMLDKRISIGTNPFDTAEKNSKLMGDPFELVTINMSSQRKTVNDVGVPTAQLVDVDGSTNSLADVSSSDTVNRAFVNPDSSILAQSNANRNRISSDPVTSKSSEVKREVDESVFDDICSTNPEWIESDNDDSDIERMTMPFLKNFQNNEIASRDFSSDRSATLATIEKLSKFREASEAAVDVVVPRSDDSNENKTDKTAPIDNITSISETLRNSVENCGDAKKKREASVLLDSLNVCLKTDSSSSSTTTAKNKPHPFSVEDQLDDSKDASPIQVAKKLSSSLHLAPAPTSKSEAGTTSTTQTVGKPKSTIKTSIPTRTATKPSKLRVGEQEKSNGQLKAATPYHRSSALSQQTAKTSTSLAPSNGFGIPAASSTPAINRGKSPSLDPNLRDTQNGLRTPFTPVAAYTVNRQPCSERKKRSVTFNEKSDKLSKSMVGAAKPMKRLSQRDGENKEN